MESGKPCHLVSPTSSRCRGAGLAGDDRLVDGITHLLHVSRVLPLEGDSVLILERVPVLTPETRLLLLSSADGEGNIAIG